MDAFILLVCSWVMKWKDSAPPPFYVAAVSSGGLSMRPCDTVDELKACTSSSVLWKTQFQSLSLSSLLVHPSNWRECYNAGWRVISSRRMESPPPAHLAESKRTEDEGLCMFTYVCVYGTGEDGERKTGTLIMSHCPGRKAKCITSIVSGVQFSHLGPV